MSEKDTNQEDDSALEDALAAYQDKLFAIIRMLMIRDMQDAPDILQRTNEKILTHAEQHDPSKSLHAWFKSVAVSQVQMYFRSKKRSRVEYDTDLVDTLGEEAQEENFFRGGELDEYLDALKGCMDKVPSVKRDLLEERYFDGKGVDDIAAEHSLSKDSLAKLFYYLRQALRACIEKTLRFRRKKQELGAGGPNFATSVHRFLDGKLNDADWKAFVQELSGSPEKRREYMLQAFLHAFMLCRKRNLFTPRAKAAKPVFRVWARCAAAAVLLLCGAVALRYAASRAQERRVAAREKTAAPAAPRRVAAAVPPRPETSPAVVFPPPAVVAARQASAPSLPKETKQKEETMKQAETAWKEVTKKSVAAAAILAATNVAVVPRTVMADDTTSYVTWSGSTTSSEQYGFYSGKYWSDGLAPHSGTNYLVADSRLEYPMRTPDAWNGTYTFGGDSLSIGLVGGTAGYVLQKTVNNAKTTYNHLYLNKGRIVVGTTGMGHIYGPVTVSAPANAHFLLMNADTKDARGLWFHGDMDGTGHLDVVCNGPSLATSGDVRLLGNNTNFTGTFTVNGSNFFLRAASAASLGNAPASLLANAVTLKNGGGFGGITGTLCSTNRGITVEATGGTLISDTDRMVLDMPIAGTGPVTKTGTRWLELRGTYSAGDLTVAQNVLILNNITLVGSQKLVVGAMTGLDISTSVLAGHMLEVQSSGILFPGTISGIGELTVTNGIFQTGCGIQMDYNVLSGASDVLNLRGDQTSFTPPFLVRPVTAIVYTNCTRRLAFLTMPDSIRTLSAADFTLDQSTLASLDPYGFVTFSFAVEKDGEGMQTAYLVYSNPMVMQTKAMATFFKDWTMGEYWSDGEPAGAGKDYLSMNSGTLRTPDKGGTDQTLYKFPGKSLSVVNTSFTLKCPRPFVADLRLYPLGIVATGSPFPFSLSGSIGIYGIPTAPSRFWALAERTLTVDADLHGSGYLECYIDSPSSVGLTVLSAANTNFFGGTRVNATVASSTATLAISDETNLGANPSNYLANALQLASNGVLHATQSLTLDDANRGLTIGLGIGSLQVDTGDTLTLNLSGTLNASGTFCVFGGGTLAMGKAMNGTGTAVFTNCAFRPLAAAVLPRAQVQFQNDSSLVLSQPAEDATLAKYGLLCTNAAAAVTVSGAVKVVVTPGNGKQETSFTLPAITLPRGQTLPVSSLNATTTFPHFKAPKWTSENIVVGGVPCTTWSLYFKSNKGTVVMLM